MHYAVIDEEFCNVVPGARRSNYSLRYELIQIGVVLLDEEYNVVDTFNEYIKPEYGHIDGFIRSLTGITQFKVSKCEKLSVVIEHFKEWLPDDAVMVSWSTSDMHQLRKETEAKMIDSSWMESKYDNWYDCQAAFSEIIQADKCYNLQEALNMSDVATEGSCHDGFSDAYNTAMLFKKMKTEREFHTSEKYLKAKEPQEKITFSLASLLSQIQIAS